MIISTVSISSIVDNMVAKLKHISLYAESHAIEVANFVVNLGLPIDHADIRRFDEKIEVIKDLFPAINSPDVIQIAFGGSPLNPQKPPNPVPSKELVYFANDGRPEWVAAFGENRVLVSCRKYTKWDTVWPAAKKRLYALLECIDPYKTVYSVDYSVTDTFRSKKTENALIPPNIFASNDFLPNHILQTSDPRWDVSQGWFDDAHASDQILVRFEARSGIQNDQVVASISNLHSQRFGFGLVVGDLHKETSNDSSRVAGIFNNFHDKNKQLLRKVLVDELLVRMRLKEE